MKQSVVSVIVALALGLSGCAPSEQKTADPTHAERGEQDGHGEEGGHHEHGEGHEGEANVVRLDAAGQRQIGLKIAEVATRPVDSTLKATGEFVANADREAHVKPRLQGTVTRIAKAVGDRVRSGETLAVVESSSLGEAQAEYLEAQARHGLNQSTYERQHKLFQSDLTARKEVQAAEHDLRLSRIALERANNQLLIYGFSKARIAQLANDRRLAPTVPVAAPISGIVIERHATLGETVTPDAEQPTFVISDISQLWVNANLYERDLQRVREGQRAVVTTPAFPGREYDGRVSIISTILDKDTRTAKARVVVANGDGRLKPEMFANIRIHVGKPSALTIPRGAVQQENGETFVFVQKEAEEFERREVQVGEPINGYVTVTSGLQAGEKVVSEGGITLKAELLKESFGEHEH